MEFVIGNSGKGYGLLYKSSSMDEQISTYIQESNSFNVNVGDKLYAYKAITDGNNYTVIFWMYTYDYSFTRGSFYKHVKWDKYSRDDFNQMAFLENITSTFASQDDIDRLRNTGDFSINNNDNIDISFSVPIDILSSVLSVLYSGIDKKIVVVFDTPPINSNPDSDYYLRKFIRDIFTFLPTSLKISTSYITFCDWDAFVKSEYRLTILPASSIKDDTNDAIIIVKANQIHQNSVVNEWLNVSKLVVESDIQNRNKFFKIYDSNYGKL